MASKQKLDIIIFLESLRDSLKDPRAITTNQILNHLTTYVAVLCEKEDKDFFSNEFERYVIKNDGKAMSSTQISDTLNRNNQFPEKYYRYLSRHKVSNLVDIFLDDNFLNDRTFFSDKIKKFSDFVGLFDSKKLTDNITKEINKDIDLSDEKRNELQSCVKSGKADIVIGTFKYVAEYGREIKRVKHNSDEVVKNVVSKTLRIEPDLLPRIPNNKTAYSDTDLPTIGSEFNIGPKREIFKTGRPPKYITFNSLIDINNDLPYSESDHLNYKGDERLFTAIRKVGDLPFERKIQLEIGEQYEVMVYYNNDIDETVDRLYMAAEVKIRAQIPRFIEAGESGIFNSIIYAVNATPREVWSSAITLGSDKSLYVSYIRHTLAIKNRGNVGDYMKNMRIDYGTFLLNEGVMIGVDIADGLVAAENSKSYGALFYKFIVKQTDFKMNVFVSKLNLNEWRKTINISPDEMFSICVSLKNLKEIESNVTISEIRTPILDLVKTSTVITSIKDEVTKKIIDADLKNGLTISNISPQEEVFITYLVKAKGPEVYLTEEILTVSDFTLSSNTSTVIEDTIAIKVIK